MANPPIAGKTHTSRGSDEDVSGTMAVRSLEKMEVKKVEERNQTTLEEEERKWKARGGKEKDRRWAQAKEREEGRKRAMVSGRIHAALGIEEKKWKEREGMEEKKEEKRREGQMEKWRRPGEIREVQTIRKPHEPKKMWWTGVRDGEDEREEKKWEDRGATEIWSYNCQKLTWQKMEDISEGVHNEGCDTYVGIQGTKRRSGEFESEQTETKTRWHDVIEIKVPWKAEEDQKHAGLALMMPRGAMKKVRSIMVPTKQWMKGRAAVIRVVTGRKDVAFVLVYPRPDSGKRDAKDTQELWYWTERCIESLPKGVTIVVMTDAMDMWDQ